MTERAERLYNCITDVGDDFLREMEKFQPRAKKPAAIDWKRWGTLAAAVLLVFGAGRWLLMDGAKMESSAPGAARPGASAPAASAPACSEPGDTPSGDNGSGAAGTDHAGENYQYGGVYVDYPYYESYGELAGAADLILEARVTGITTGVAFDTGLDVNESDPRRYSFYTVVELEVIDVLKGGGETGETVQLKLPEPAPADGGEQPEPPLEVGDRNFYFLADYRSEIPDMPCSLLNPAQAVVSVDGDRVWAQSALLEDGGQGSVPMDKNEFRDWILAELK